MKPTKYCKSVNYSGEEGEGRNFRRFQRKTQISLFCKRGPLPKTTDYGANISGGKQLVDVAFLVRKYVVVAFMVKKQLMVFVFMLGTTYGNVIYGSRQLVVIAFIVRDTRGCDKILPEQSYI
jgi:hypothetical protein